jgi:geranylgeranyl pyrophosphate synthase
MPPTDTDPNGNGAVWELPRRLGLVQQIQQLREFILRWVEECDPEVREIIRHQVSGRAKYFRPVTIFACYRAATGKPIPTTLIPTVAALELTHNVTLIIDDILDRSRFRRGNLSLHCRFGFLPALMTAGYISSAGSKMVASDPYSTRLLAELLQRLGVAECLQWRLRRQPLGVEDWRTIAAEDTGSMFEICARLGTRDNRLQKFGQLLGILYHGCDDVADVRGTTALGGGSAKDIEDGILTLPAAIAIRDPETAILFRHPSPRNIKVVTEKLVAALPESEEYLDLIASEAESEANSSASFPEQLIDLVQDTRRLSRC